MVQSDKKGNVLGIKISNLKTTPPIRILESTDGDNLTDARIALYHFNERSKYFESMGEARYTNVLGEFFEFALLGAFLLELLFIFTFGVLMTLPFFLVSVCNLFLWLFYLKEKNLVR